MYPVRRRISSVSTSSTCLLPDALAKALRESTAVPGRHARTTPVAVAARNQGLEHPFQRDSELLGDLVRAEIIRLKFADIVRDSGSIQDLHGPRLHGKRRLPLAGRERQGFPGGILVGRRLGRPPGAVPK